MRGYFTIILAVEFAEPRDPKALREAIAARGERFDLNVVVLPDEGRHDRPGPRRRAVHPDRPRRRQPAGSSTGSPAAWPRAGSTSSTCTPGPTAGGSRMVMEAFLPPDLPPAERPGRAGAIRRATWGWRPTSSTRTSSSPPPSRAPSASAPSPEPRRERRRCIALKTCWPRWHGPPAQARRPHRDDGRRPARAAPRPTSPTLCDRIRDRLIEVRRPPPRRLPGGREPLRHPDRQPPDRRQPDRLGRRRPRRRRAPRRRPDARRGGRRGRASTSSAASPRWSRRAGPRPRTRLIEALPEVLSTTSGSAPRSTSARRPPGSTWTRSPCSAASCKDTAERTRTHDGFGCAKLVIFANAPTDNPFMAGAFHGVGEPDCVINIGVSGPGVVKAAVEDLVTQRPDPADAGRDRRGDQEHRLPRHPGRRADRPRGRRAARRRLRDRRPVAGPDAPGRRLRRRDPPGDGRRAARRPRLDRRAGPAQRRGEEGRQLRLVVRRRPLRGVRRRQRGRGPGRGRRAAAT